MHVATRGSRNSVSADAQLAQAFNLTSQDRYLEFTVANGVVAWIPVISDKLAKLEK
jgi:hypothetical protein